MEKKYEQVIRFVQQTPWAVKPDMLLTIRGIASAKLAGVELEPVAAKAPNKTVTPGAVAVLPLWGVIFPHAGLMSNISGGVGLDTWIEDFRALVNDPSISTIVLDVNSPGGAVAMVPEAAAEVRAARAKKRIIAVANPEIASAAYWIASQAEQIVAPLSSMVGSVGVIAEHTDVSKLEEMAGVTRTYITAGQFKAEQLGPLTEEAKQAIQDNVDSAYAMFVSDVAKGRGVSVSAVEATYGQGRMLTAADALAAGMVDKIGTLDTVLAKELPTGKQRMRSEEESAELTSEAPALLTEGADVATVTVESVSETADFAGYFVGQNMLVASTGTPLLEGSNWVILPAVESEAAEASAELSVDTPDTSGADQPEQNNTQRDSGSLKGTASRGASHKTSEEEEMGERMTLDELTARRDEILTRMREIHTDAQGRQFREEEQFEFNQLDDERAAVEVAIDDVSDREDRLAAAEGDPRRTISGDGTRRASRRNRGGVYTNVNRHLPENIYDLAAYRGYAQSPEEYVTLYREAAKSLVENLPFETDNLDKAREHSMKMLARDSRDGAFATRLLTAGSPLYDRAFGKMVRGLPLNTSEDAAIKAAVSNTGLGSETPVPVTIDPTVILTSDGSINPLREIARTVTITGNKWQGISSDGVDVTYEAELSQVADQTPSFDAPVAEVAKAHAYIEFSIEVDQDWGELRSNLGLMFQDAKDMKEANKFLLGTGTNEPQGLLDALSGSGSIVETSTIDTFGVEDVYSVKGALPPRFRSSASWLANDTIYSLIRQFDEAGGSALWAQLGADRPAVLLGKPVYEASEMSDESTTGGEDIMIYGDFSRGFIIVDRIGMNVELIPHVLGNNRRPIGARALYAYFRNTSQLLTENAFRVLRVKAS